MSEFWYGVLAAGCGVIGIAAIVWTFMFVAVGLMDMPNRFVAWTIRVAVMSIVIASVITLMWAAFG